jgi:predicted enzyme related to lactoylglutathione lyase
MEMPDMGYNIVSTGPAGDDGMPSEPGFIGGGMLQRQDPVTKPVIVVQVDDIDATLKQVGSCGGSAVSEKLTVGEMGFAAYFTDSEGNLMGLWQNAG